MTRRSVDERIKEGNRELNREIQEIFVVDIFHSYLILSQEISLKENNNKNKKYFMQNLENYNHIRFRSFILMSPNLYRVFYTLSRTVLYLFPEFKVSICLTR